MRRIGLAVVLALGLLVLPLAVEAQQRVRVHRIGFLAGPTLPTSDSDGFRQGLREHGYVEGQNLLLEWRVAWLEGRNVVIEWRSAEGRTDRLTGLAAELVDLKVDVIVTAGSTPATLAAKRATTTTPVVMVAVGAPLDTGLVASLARPGGNVTGFTTLGGEVAKSPPSAWSS